METKKEIRKRIREVRRRQARESHIQATDMITRQVVRHDWFREAADLYCYVDFDGEVGTREIIEAAWRLGKNVFVPRILGDNMRFFRLRSFDELKPGTFGVLEPPGCAEEAEGMSGFMIMPGVAFDRARNRVGYGKGYYDSYLAEHPKLHTAAIAFDLQIVERIEAEVQDIRPELLITDTNVYGKE